MCLLFDILHWTRLIAYNCEINNNLLLSIVQCWPFRRCEILKYLLPLWTWCKNTLHSIILVCSIVFCKIRSKSRNAESNIMTALVSFSCFVYSSIKWWNRWGIRNLINEVVDLFQNVIFMLIFKCRVILRSFNWCNYIRISIICPFSKCKWIDFIMIYNILGKLLKPFRLCLCY